MKRKQHLGEMLLAGRVISRDVLEAAIEDGKRSGQRLGHVLIDQGHLTEEALAKFLEKQLDMPVVDINREYTLDKRFRLLPHKYCVEKVVAPLKYNKGQLTIAMADPTNYAVIDEVRFMTDASVEVVLATENSIISFLEQQPAVRPAGRGKSATVDEGPVISGINYAMAIDDIDNLNEQKLAEMADDAPVVKLVNTLIADAINRHASDIHFETYEEEMRVKYRIDGVLHDVSSPPRAMQPALISRIKIISRLDISERRLPQDGRVSLEINERRIDLRVSIVPTIHGENAVLRILDKGSVVLDMANLGLSEGESELIRSEARRPHGMFLVAGPTGSGKTTTLYSILQYVRQFENKILTIEDPVEYQMDGVTQVQVHTEIGLDFARGLRSFLRHDPDVIMVGEIRDLETAEIAIRAALTGHMVLSTVHTNDSPSAITRFVDMGIPPYLVTATFNMVLSQRLVRRICPECRARMKLTKTKLAELGLSGRLRDGTMVSYGKGCKACGNSGYSGRFAVFEIMRVSDKIREALLRGGSLGDIRKAARAGGMLSLMDQALRKVKEGETTLDEAIRISGGEELDFDELF